MSVRFFDPKEIEGKIGRCISPKLQCVCQGKPVNIKSIDHVGGIQIDGELKQGENGFSCTIKANVAMENGDVQSSFFRTFLGKCTITEDAEVVIKEPLQLLYEQR